MVRIRVCSVLVMIVKCFKPVKKMLRSNSKPGQTNIMFSHGLDSTVFKLVKLMLCLAHGPNKSVFSTGNDSQVFQPGQNNVVFYINTWSE